MGEVLPEIRNCVESDFRRLACLLLEEGLKSWAAREWLRYSDEEADCTLQFHRSCQGLTRSIPEFGLFHAELESVAPDEAIVEAKESANKSPRPDMRIMIVGSEVGVSVECKRLRRTSTDFRNYANRGLKRFSSGRYGAGDSFGVMVGYLQGCSIERALEGVNGVIMKSPEFERTEALNPNGSTPTFHRLLSQHDRSEWGMFSVLHLLAEVGLSSQPDPRILSSIEEKGATAPSSSPQLWPLRFDWIPGEDAVQNASLIDDCVRLYNAHYGIWGIHSPKYGKPVRMPRGVLRNLAASPEASLAVAYTQDSLIAYCLAVKLETDSGVVSWVVQLVVHGAYRRMRIATKLLFSVWQFSDCFCWGLATSNPFAVRALETATRRQCTPRVITSAGPPVLRELADHVPYLPRQMSRKNAHQLRPVVDTKFFVDHTESTKIRQSGRVSGRRWRLGDLAEGEEWFACTFGSQRAEALSTSRVRELLKGSDEIWLSAYERMTLDESHVWRRYAEAEVEFCLTQVASDRPLRIADVGCGDGRHARLMAERGHEVVAIDISEALLTRARLIPSGANISWLEHDARERLPVSDLDLVVALYDVVGSSADEADDRRILSNLASSLSVGGTLVLSVMNAEESIKSLSDEQSPKTILDFIDCLEKLPPSTTMEQSGSVFDPELLLYFEGTFYRKEQFDGGPGRLPAEYVVRDRRFLADDVRAALTEVGLDVVNVFPSRLGHWLEGPPGDPSGKEIVAVARKPHAS